MFSQTFEDFEIIIVDDGSTDGTGRLLEGIQDRRFHYVRQENSGRAYARNACISQARGEWLAFLDADDLWLPDKLARQIQAVRQDPDIVLVYSQAYAFFERDRENGTPIDLTAGQLTGSGPGQVANCEREFLLAEYHVPTSTVLARAAKVREVGGFDPAFSVGEDWDLFMRMGMQGPVCFLAEALAGYWLGPYQNHYERGRKYDWHNELLKVVEKNLLLGNYFSKSPDFARRVLAAWEWRCAVVERGIGNADSGRRHAQRAFENIPGLAEQQAFLKETSELAINVKAPTANDKEIRAELQSIILDLVPADRNPRQVLRAATGVLYESLSFRAYASRDFKRGLRYAFLAGIHRPEIIGNIGMWKTGIWGLLKAKNT